MRLASYQSTDKQNEVTGRYGNDQYASRSAWVEPDFSLVDVSQAYQAVARRLTRIDPEKSQRYSTVEGLIQSFERFESWNWLTELRDMWHRAVQSGDESAARCRRSPEDVRLCAPVQPKSFRDFYAFEQHVKTCRRRRGLDMVPEWYDFPVFYFSNVSGIRGPLDPIWAPEGSRELDFELEVGCVIGRMGRSVSVTQADSMIAGYVIVNDWSARDIQRAEMRVGLGPAKGKDFATTLGPYLVTPCELRDVSTSTHAGLRYSLNMSASVNGLKVSGGNLIDLHYTFAQMIERASADVDLQALDLIGSGTVGTGCILELGTEVQSWLQPGDVVQFDVERLGSLQTPIVQRPGHRG